MHVYCTDKFREKVNAYGLDAPFRELCANVKHTDNIRTVCAFFEPLGPYLKRREAKVRFLARLKRVDSENVLCFLVVLERKDKDYEALLMDPRQIGAKVLDPMLKDDEVRSHLDEERAAEQAEYAKGDQLPPLPAEMLPWMHAPGWDTSPLGNELVVYESNEWISRFRSKDLSRFRLRYYDIVSQIVYGGASGVQAREISPGVSVCSSEEYSVLYSLVQTIGPTVREILFLLAPLRSQAPEQELQSIINRSPFVESHEALTIEALARFASRAYPGYVLCDERIWMAIEEEEEANLALSPEEEQVLRSVSAPENGGGGFPLFINGRAGSGKSTMLFYLFADYCYLKWRQNLPGEPLFLTYNERLLEIAQETVRKLLLSHHRFLVEKREDEGEPSAQGFFKPFRKFLLRLLPEEELKRFAPDKYVNFYRFKQLYLGKHLPDNDRAQTLRLPEAKHWSPEFCWHVIRTFIKGRSVAEYTTPDYYRETARKERTIDEDTYERIYESIWKQWYLPLTTGKGYWDDQDLIRRVLELKCYASKYTAIFCDEAQDFTRLELQLIMRLSVFSQYDLGREPLRNLPFAFAGDPFQTLNPTGFRWSSLQAAFYEEVMAALDPADEHRLGMRFHELTYNYRSTPPVVRAANLIQLWRHVLLKLREILPQQCWRPDKLTEFPEPRKFILGENISPEELAQHAQDTIIIVPAEEGQETSYVDDDKVLSKVVMQRQEGYPPKNVLSAIAAKGLEFDRVIVYKFGEACDEQAWSSVWRRGSDAANDHSLELEYFLNKLYVAATRAKRYLFVVDSSEGDQRLWHHGDSLESVEPFLTKTGDRTRWENLVGIIPRGTPDNVAEIVEDDPRSVAQELESKGRSLGEPDLLRRAKQFYCVAGETARANLCEARALSIEEKHREAGRLFLKENETDEARDCFWKGECWEDLVKLYETCGATAGKKK